MVIYYYYYYYLLVVLCVIIGPLFERRARVVPCRLIFIRYIFIYSHILYLCIYLTVPRWIVAMNIYLHDRRFLLQKKKLAIGGQSFRVRYLPVCKYRSGMTKETKKIAAY